MGMPGKSLAMFLLTNVARACGVFIRDLRDPGFANHHLRAMDTVRRQVSQSQPSCIGAQRLGSSTAPLKV